MPIYEYHCPDCGKDLEIIVKSSTAKPECPECGGKALTKKFSSFAVSAGSGKKGRCPASDASPCGRGGCGCGSGCCHSV